MALGAQSFRVCHPQIRPQGRRVSGCRCWDMRTEEKTLVTQAILMRIGMGQGQKETHF